MRNFKILLLHLILLLIILIYNKSDEFKLIINKNKYNSLLPKIKLNDSHTSSMAEIFKSRRLFFNGSILTKEYIRYVRDRTINKKINYINKNYEGLEPNLSFTYNRNQQIKINDFYNLCLKNQLILNESFIKNYEKPLVSVIIVSYNKMDVILKSIISVLNQSLKNIEIIIVDDHSTDNSEFIFEDLLKKDSRIRIFTHLKNMGVWRSRIDGFLFSNAPYVIHFDCGDFYADNFILEDIYSIAIKYNLDSVRFGYRETFNKDHLTLNDKIYTFSEKDRKIVYGRRAYNIYGMKYGPIWIRLTKAEIFTKGLYLLDYYILNAYKNLFEDRWWNTIANNVSYSYLMVNRIGYIYVNDHLGEGHIRHGNRTLNEKMVKELILFILFDYETNKNIIKALQKVLHNGVNLEFSKRKRQIMKQ